MESGIVMSMAWRYFIATAAFLLAVMSIVLHRRYFEWVARLINVAPRFGEQPDLRGAAAFAWGTPLFFFLLAMFLIFS